MLLGNQFSNAFDTEAVHS